VTAVRICPGLPLKIHYDPFFCPNEYSIFLYTCIYSVYVMQKSVKSKVIPIRFGEEELQKIDSLLDKTGLRSRSEFIREAVQYYLDNVAEMRIIELRDISKDQAKKEILEYIKERKEAETFDIANDLRLDLKLTMKALKELWEEGRIE